MARGVQDAVATLPGWATEDNGLLHVRGVDDGFLYVIDGVPVYERLDPLSGHRPPTSRTSSRSTSSPATFRRSSATRRAVSSTCDRNRSARIGSGRRRSNAAATTRSPLRGWRRGDSLPALAMTVVAHGQQSDRFLDPIHPDNFHNHGALGSAESQLMWSGIGLGCRHRQRRIRRDGLRRSEHRHAGAASQDQRQRDQTGLRDAVVATRILIVDLFTARGVHAPIEGGACRQRGRHAAFCRSPTAAWFAAA